jgi:superfamily II DNA or RNA helicase
MSFKDLELKLIYDIPELVKVELRKYQKEERPYRKSKKTLHLPTYIKKLNGYQIEAIEKLKANNWRGILEMATGTGKTITSIAASMEYLSIKGRIFLIVVVPFNHLVEQWEDNILSFGYKVPIKCYDSKASWYGKLNRRIKDYNIRLTDCETLIVSYKTFASSDFQELCSKIKDNVFFVADECHYMGSDSLRDCMTENFEVRVGLSATPDRWFDEEGTKRLRDYFGDTIFEYDMKMAIDNGFLCKYEYEPVIVSLTPGEHEEYSDLTKKITKMFLANKKMDENTTLERAILKRSNILSKAENKLPTFIEMLKKQMIEEKVKHTLVYCSKGESQKVTKMIAELGIRAHEFVYKVKNADRQKILEAFAKGDIQILVAIKCLDEGVDIPGTRTAYFLASTSNPREFIQRRGRVLRNAPGKHLAKIIDFIVFPQSKPLSSGEIGTADSSIIQKEMPRFAEFYRYAFNSEYARGVIRKYLSPYNLEYLMDKLPWQVYKERKEKYSDEQYD